LENAVERAVVLEGDDLVDVDVLPEGVTDPSGTPAGRASLPSLNHLPFAQAKELAVRAFEHQYLTSALERGGENVSAAALASGLDRSNFRRLLKQHGIARAAGGGGGDEPLET
jgi:two-component system response regulator HydG